MKGRERVGRERDGERNGIKVRQVSEIFLTFVVPYSNSCSIIELIEGK